MIQRIQTLFLLAALVLLTVLLFVPLAYFANNETLYYHEIQPLLIMNIIGVLLCIATIGLYKARMIQIRLCIFNALILFGLQGWIVYLFFQRVDGMVFSITAVFPIIAAILLILAIRYIGRDEAMIRSLQRLRK